MGAVRSVQKAARARGSSGEKSWKRKWEETHAKAVKRGGPQGSAANATVWIPPMGDAQPGEGRNARRARGEQAELRGACGGDGQVKRGVGGFVQGLRLGRKRGLSRGGDGCGQNVDAIPAELAGAAA